MYDKKLVITGGSKMYNRDVKRRDCLNDVIVYDTIRGDWLDIIATGSYLEPRRYHTACIVGTQLLIHGGLNDRDAYLKDLLALNLAASPEKPNEYDRGFRWMQLKVDNQTQRPGGLAYHSCQLVLLPERYKTPRLINLTALPELPTGRNRVPPS